jgi:hypothetical protein
MLKICHAELTSDKYSISFRGEDDSFDWDQFFLVISANAHLHARVRVSEEV